ncbi:MAG: hypothetical protein JSR21_13590 [Proteobacteria bacterium]|nr:hypothetical protein [Pseudomonadota bacterium]
MTDTPQPMLSVASLFAEREARRERERTADEQLKQKAQEELAAYKKRLDEFLLTDAHIETVLDRIKRAFDRGETELMLVSFPSSFCTDSGRAVANADVPPINKAAAPGPDAEPAWLATLPKGARPIYNYWKQTLKPGGFQFSARIVNFPSGMPGDVGLFFSWPKDLQA